VAAAFGVHCPYSSAPTIQFGHYLSIQKNSIAKPLLLNLLRTFPLFYVTVSHSPHPSSKAIRISRTNISQIRMIRIRLTPDMYPLEPDRCIRLIKPHAPIRGLASGQVPIIHAESDTAVGVV